jgi:hypothetical protein
LQPLIHLWIRTLQILKIEDSVPTLLSGLGHVFTPVQPGASDVHQAIPEVRKIHLWCSVRVMRPPVRVDAEDVVAICGAQPEGRLFGDVELASKVASDGLILVHLFEDGDRLVDAFNRTPQLGEVGLDEGVDLRLVVDRKCPIPNVTEELGGSAELHEVAEEPSNQSVIEIAARILIQ